MTPDDLHNAVDTICDAWPKARAAFRGGLRARSYDAPTITTSGHSDPTGETVVNGHAVAWQAELHDVACIFIERMPRDPESLRTAWHDLFNRCPTGWAETAIRRMYTLADNALRWWPPPATTRKGDRVGDIEIGDGRRQANDTEHCGLCGNTLPAVRGVRRFVPDANGSGQWFCKSPCWYTITMDRGIHPRQQHVA